MGAQKTDSLTLSEVNEKIIKTYYEIKVSKSEKAKGDRTKYLRKLLKIKKGLIYGANR